MRWQKKPVADPGQSWRSRWHWKFAWLPVTFEHGTREPRRAWLEWVLRRGELRGTLEDGDYWLYEYMPATRENQVKL